MAADAPVILWLIGDQSSLQLLVTSQQKMDDVNNLFHFTAWILFIVQLQFLEQFYTFPLSCCSYLEKNMAYVAVNYVNPNHDRR